MEDYEGKEKIEKKKKLLIAADNFLPRWDGVARFLSEIIPDLKEQFEISVIAPEYKGDYQEIEGVHVIRIPVSRIKIADYPIPKPGFAATIEHVMKTDIVFVNSIGPIGAIAILSAHYLKKPVVSYVHSIEWELFARALTQSKILEKFIFFFSKIYMRFLYNKTSLIIVPNIETGELLKYEGIKISKYVVHMGINVDKFKPPLNKKEAKAKVNINPDNFVIGYVGRLAREKNLITLLNAFKQLKKKYKNINLLIVGDGLLSIKNQFAGEKGVILTGSLNDIVPYLQAMDVYVLPSLTETSSLSTMEAMSCGLPVVVTKVGGLKTYIEDRENGVFFPKKNVTVLTLKLEWLMKKEYVRTILGKNARETIIGELNWSKTVSNIKEVLGGF
ncbi:MAG: glycosyltransferase [Candidatus Woesearchaeota archaeon]